MKRILMALAALALAAPAMAAMGERIFAPVGGISIEKPDGWFLIPPDAALDNLQSYDFEDPRVQRSLAAPLITIMRDPPEKVDGIIPTIKLNFIAYPAIAQRGAVGATEDMIGAMRTIFPDIRMLTPPRRETIAGRASARTIVVLSLRRDDELWQIEAEMILVPRGTTGFFLLGFSCEAGKVAENRALFDAALASFRIDAK